MIITRDQVKLYLGITDNTYDSQIDAYLPIIDSKVKLICNHDFNDVYYANLYNNKYIEIAEIRGETIEAGSQISGDGIPTGSYITNIFMQKAEINGTTYTPPFIEISETATADTTGSYLFTNIPMGYLPTLAKGVWWLIQGENTNAVKGSVASKSIGPVSVSFTDLDNKLDGISGMPTWFVKALPHYMSGL